MEYKARSIKFLSYLLLFSVLYLIFATYSFAEDDKYLRLISDDLHSKDEVKSIQALEQLIEYQAVTPTLEAVKLIFSVIETPSSSIRLKIEKSIPHIKITDEIIKWFEDDTISSPNSQIRLLALHIIGANLTNEYPGTITSLNILNKFIYDPEEQIRVEAIKYLAQINDTAIIPLLSVAFTDGSYAVRKLVLEALKNYLYSSAALDILLKRYPYESSLTLQFEIEKVIIATVGSCISGTDIILTSLKSESPEIRALASRVIGKSPFIRTVNPDEKEKYIKGLLDFQYNDTEDVIASRIWSLMILCDKTPSLVTELYIKVIFDSQYPISTRLFALDSLYSIEQRAKSIEEVYSAFRGTLHSTIDWRLKSYWHSLTEKSIPMDIGTLYAQRSTLLRCRFEPLKTESLLKYGGDKETESAVQLGLEYLMRTQEEDGSWNCARHNPWHNKFLLPNFTNEDELVDVSVTGLNLLCFLASGSTHKYGPYQEVVRKGLEYIRDAQDKTGVINIPKGHIHNERCLVHGEDHGVLPRRYNHNISTLVLVETYAMTGDEIIKDAAQRALEHSKNTPEQGFPWSFYLEKTDMGTSIFYITALKIAQQTDLIVSPKEIEKVKVYLDKLTDKTSGRIIHICSIPICFGGMDSTAAGLFAHILMNTGKKNPIVTKSADWLKQFLPHWEPFYQYASYPNLLFLEDNIMNEWHWHYQTLAFKEIGGTYWEDWNKAYKDLILKHQRKGGALDGSWDPEGPWATIGGRLYSTAFSILSLQAYYSYSF